MSEPLHCFRELRVYRDAFDAALELFGVTKSFPASERFQLIDQIRRSSRSVCANLAEAWRKRRYRAAFIAKISDAESEAAESQVWLDFALKCGYIDQATWERLDRQFDKIQRQLVRMITGADHWIIGPTKDSQAAG